jgi:hypothetical protein
VTRVVSGCFRGFHLTALAVFFFGAAVGAGGKRTISMSFFCGAPGVLRPSATYLSSSTVNLATISGLGDLDFRDR